MKTSSPHFLERDHTIDSLNKKINELEDIVRLLRLKIFSSSSEKVEIDSLQAELFNEIEQEAPKEKEKDEFVDVPPHKRKKKRPRISPDLPREENLIELPPEERFCPHDGTPLEEIGEEVSEQVDYILASINVIKNVRKKYSCPCCREGVKIAPLAPSIIPKSMATPTLLAAVVIAKFIDHLPLYRQEKMFARMGFSVTRSTLARWMIQVADAFQAITNLLHERLLESTYLQADETRTQVLKESGKKATSRSYMWVFFTPGEDSIVYYHYAPGRGGSVPLALLEGFSGYLQCDGYDGYSELCRKEEVTRLGCMDHFRRKFAEALKASKKNTTSIEFIKLIGELYQVESELKDATPEVRKETRDKKSAPVLERIKKKMDNLQGRFSPSSLNGQAIRYGLNEWKYLSGYLADGRLEMSNIFVENKIRPFALGRKNWPFSDSVEGAESSAALYTIIETAKANKLDVLSYLTRLINEIPKAKELKDFERLLPLRSIQNPSPSNSS